MTQGHTNLANWFKRGGTRLSVLDLRHLPAESFSCNTVTGFLLQPGGTREKQGANLEQSEIWMAPLHRAASPGTQDSQLGTCWLPMNYSWNQKLINWKVTFNKITEKKHKKYCFFFLVVFELPHKMPLTWDCFEILNLCTTAFWPSRAFGRMADDDFSQNCMWIILNFSPSVHPSVHLTVHPPILCHFFSRTEIVYWTIQTVFRWRQAYTWTNHQFIVRPTIRNPENPQRTSGQTQRKLQVCRHLVPPPFLLRSLSRRLSGTQHEQLHACWSSNRAEINFHDTVRWYFSSEQSATPVALL